jgi:hypothetical protein
MSAVFVLDLEDVHGSARNTSQHSVSHKRRELREGVRQTIAEMLTQVRENVSQR